MENSIVLTKIIDLSQKRIKYFSIFFIQGISSTTDQFCDRQKPESPFRRSKRPLLSFDRFCTIYDWPDVGQLYHEHVKPAKILAFNAGLSILLLPLESMNLGWVSLIAFYTVFLLMSIMFPTIFALGIKDLGPQTKKGASIIAMAVVGGAVYPPLMGHISDLYSMSVGFLAPIPLFMFILYFGIRGHNVKS